MMQDQKSLTRRWLSCSGWGMEHVALVFSYKGGWFIRKGQWCAKVNILRLTVGYLNATINRKTQNTEPEIGTDGSSQTRQNPRVDGYGSGFGPPRRCGSGFWTVLEPNRNVFPVRTRTAGGLPGPVANTTQRGTSFSTSQFVCRCLSSRFWGILRFLIGIGRRATITTLCVEVIWRIFDDRLPIVIYTGHSFLSPAKFERCVPLDMHIKGTRVSATLSVVYMLIGMVLSSRISPDLCLPPPVRSLHFSIEAFRWRIAVNATLKGVNEMLRVGWLPHQPSHGLMMSQLQYLLGRWWLSFHLISSRVWSSHSPRAWSSSMVAMSFWTPSPFLKLGKRRAVFSSFSTLF